jgi:hypothetical protein
MSDNNDKQPDKIIIPTPNPGDIGKLSEGIDIPKNTPTPNVTPPPSIKK